jgi:membrane protein
MKTFGFHTILGLPRAALRVWRLASERHIGLVSAGVAFFSVLSVFPALVAVVTLWGMFADPFVVAAQLEGLRPHLPPEAYDLIAAQVKGLVEAPSGRMGWTTLLALLVTLWTVRAGVSALVSGVNAIFGTAQRGGLSHEILSLVLTLVMLGAALAALAAGIAVPLLLAFAPLGPFETLVVTAARWSIAPLVTILSIGLIYRYAPNLEGARPRMLSPGLGVAVGLWLVSSEGFSIYLANFANYNKVYGSIGALAALLFWGYLSAYAILLGAAVNASLREGRPQPGQPAQPL